MNREILFRGKRKFNGVWVVGHYISYQHNYHSMVTENINNPIPRGGQNYPIVSYEIDSSTIGQYTGLTDRNGVKIFEGDIVSDETTHKNAVVRFQRCAFWLVYPGHDDLNDCEWDDYAGQLAVMGNIYDNPELLSVQ